MENFQMTNLGQPVQREPREEDVRKELNGAQIGKDNPICQPLK